MLKIQSPKLTINGYEFKLVTNPLVKLEDGLIIFSITYNKILMNRIKNYNLIGFHNKIEIIKGDKTILIDNARPIRIEKYDHIIVSIFKFFTNTQDWEDRPLVETSII